MVAYLDGRRYARFVEYLGDLLAGPPERLAAAHVASPEVANVLPALLHRDLADVLDAGSLVTGPEASLARFHRLSAPLIQRFYAGRLTVLDRARILSGRPPVPLLRAARSVLERPVAAGPA